MRARVILSAASVFWIIACLPVAMGTAVAWLAHQELQKAPMLLHYLANLWYALGILFIPLVVLSILFGWRLHRTLDDRKALKIMALPGWALVLFLTLGGVVVTLAR